MHTCTMTGQSALRSGLGIIEGTHCWKHRHRKRRVSALTEGFLLFKASTTSSWILAREVWGGGRGVTKGRRVTKGSA